MTTLLPDAVTLTPSGDATVRCYRSRVTLRTDAPRIQRAGKDVHQLHKLVMDSIATKHHSQHNAQVRAALGVLFAAQRQPHETDHSKAGPVTGLMMQSLLEPTWNQDEITSATTQWHEDTYHLHDTITVRAWLNPTKRVHSDPATRVGRTGPRINLANPEQATKWVHHTFARHGLDVNTTTTILGEQQGLTSTKRKGFGIVLRPVVTEGIITDPEAFAHAVLSGIGPGKAYGAGMLHISSL